MVDLVRLSFADADRPARSGRFVLDEDGQVRLRVSPALAQALERAVGDPSIDLAPLRFDGRQAGLALTAALAKGVSARFLECELPSGAFVLRGYIRGWVALTLDPGDFDPDVAWEFSMAVNDAKLEAPRP